MRCEFTDECDFAEFLQEFSNLSDEDGVARELTDDRDVIHGTKCVRGIQSRTPDRTIQRDFEFVKWGRCLL